MNLTDRERAIIRKAIRRYATDLLNETMTKENHATIVAIWGILDALKKGEVS